MRIASFDIFDTTLLRKCGSPQNIFRLLAERIFPNDELKQKKFFEWRRNTETTALSDSKNYLTLNDIYFLGKYPFDNIDYAIRQEEKVEGENLIANENIKDIIEQKRSEGYTILFISDMYLGSTFLKDILLREGCIKENEKVIVSCEEKARKDSGELYDKIRKEYQPEEWVHVGDNRQSDYIQALKHDIHATLYQTKYTCQEERIKSLGTLEAECTAGEIRSLRYSEKAKSAHYLLALEYIAPAYSAYVEWIFRKAKERENSTIYFLSRDGYILYSIAKKYKEKYETASDLRFLFVSRKALLPAFLHIADKNAFLSILDNSTAIGRKVSDLLSLWNTNKSILENKFNISFPYDTIRTKSEETHFLNTIYDSSFIKEYKENTKRDYNLVIEYLKQEGLTNNGNSILVDVGWVGATRIMINSLLQSNGSSPVSFLYYGVRHDVFSKDYGDYSSFTGKSKPYVEITTHLIEQYYSASPYQSTIGYDSSKNNTIEPIFKANGEDGVKTLAKYNILAAEDFMEADNFLIRMKDEELQNLAIKSVSALYNVVDSDIDITPLLNAEATDNEPFVKVFNNAEIIEFLFSGKRIGTFDRACNRLTFGKRWSAFTWMAHRLARKIHHKLSPHSKL